MRIMRKDYLDLLWWIRGKILTLINKTKAMNLQNYKIRTNGRNKEIIAKAKELGYKFYEFKLYYDCPLLYLYEDKWISTGNNLQLFKLHSYHEISVDGFLRLGKAKPDAYISDGYMLNFRLRDGKGTGITQDLTSAHLYNLMSENDYKKKYPAKKKLQFRGHDVTVHDTCIDIGCKTYTKEALRSFMFIADEIEESDYFFNKVIRFLKNNKEELGL